MVRIAKFNNGCKPDRGNGLIIKPASKTGDSGGAAEDDGRLGGAEFILWSFSNQVRVPLRSDLSST